MNKGRGSTSKQAENIVLVGRTGNGKSATANSLIGEKVFESRAHAAGITMKCQKREVVTGDGHKYNVIDTPGLFDLSVSAEYISREIVRCLTLAEGGIHAAILVLSARTRITQEEENTLKTLQALFGSEILAYVIVVFTGGDVLEEDNETLEDFLSRGCPAFIKEVLRMSGNRMVLFNNKTRDEGKKAEQVKKLFSLVDEIKRRNHGQAYTDDMYHEIKEHTDKLRKEEEELELKNHSADVKSQLKRQLNASYEDSIKILSNAAEKKLRTAVEEQENATGINASFSLGSDGKPRISMSVPVPIGGGGGGGGFPCSIL